MTCSHSHLLTNSRGHCCYLCGLPFENMRLWKYGALWFWVDT